MKEPTSRQDSTTDPQASDRSDPETRSRGGAGGAAPAPGDPHELEAQEGAGGRDADGVAGDPLFELRWEFDALNDRHLRLAAEFNNYRRRSEQERIENRARAQADLLGRLLDVLDDLQRVAELDLESATVEAIMEGIDLVERKFVRVLDDTDVDVIDPVEAAFDPERMEAILRVPTDTAELDDRVAQVFQKGYALKGVLVRPARVSVFKQE